MKKRGKNKMTLGGFKRWTLSSIGRNINMPADVLAKKGQFLGLGLHSFLKAFDFLATEPSTDLSNCFGIGPLGP